MNSFLKKILLRISELSNIILITVPFAVAWYLAYAPGIASPFFGRGNWVVLVLFALVYLTYCRIYDSFHVSLNRVSTVIMSQFLSALIADGILFLVIWLLTQHFPPVLPMAAAFAVQILLAALWCWVTHFWYFRTFAARPTVIIYDQRHDMEHLISQYGLERKFHVVDSCDVASALENGLSILDGAEVAFLCGIHSHERNIILKRCISRGIQTYLMPRLGDVLMSGAQQVHLCHLPMLKVARYDPSPEYLFVKRLMDIVICGVASVVLLPVMAAVAIAIKVTDGGPVFYKQRRLTKDGKVFEVLKFRSMRVDAEKDGVARLSSGESDDRITPVGRFIRKCRLDELPQLFNILSGSMSIVGPRPERPEIAAQYEQELPEFSLRLQAKGGLTGYAQVYGKYNTTPYDKLQMDLMYIANPSILADWKIMFATVKVLFQAESTEGVAEEQTTALTKPETKRAAALCNQENLQNTALSSGERQRAC